MLTNWWITDGVVYDIDTSATSAYIVGDFDYVGPNTGNGNVLSSATGKVPLVWSGPNGNVHAAVADGNGGWFIGGDFDYVDGIAIDNLAHLNPDGSLDEGWIPNPNGIVNEILLNGNDLYVAGSFTMIQSSTRNKVAKFNATTGALLPWNAGSIGSSIEDMIIVDEYLYIGGSFSGGAVSTTPRLARVLISDASVDIDWDPSPTSPVYALATDGTYLYVGGEFTEIESAMQGKLAKLLISDHSLEVWNPASGGAIPTVRALQIDGTDLYVGGQFTTMGGLSRRGAAKVSTVDASLDPWNPSIMGLFGFGVQSMLVHGNEVFIGGNFRNHSSNNFIGRLLKFNDTDGTMVSGWLPKPTGLVRALASDGTNIYAGGEFSSIGGIETMNVAKLDLVSGSADEDFSVSMNTSTSARSVLVHGDDLFVGGAFRTVNGDSGRDRIVRLSASDGSLALPVWEPAMNTGISSSIYVSTMAILNDSIYVAGSSLSLIGGQTVDNIGRVSLTTAAGDPTWKPEVGGTIYDIEFSGTDLYVAGTFTDIDNSGISTGIGRMAKLNANDDLVDVTWSAIVAPDDEVNVIEIDGDDLYVGGEFGMISGLSRNRIAKLDLVSGSITDTGWSGSVTGVEVSDIAIHSSELYIGGNFTTVNGQSQIDFARLYIDDGTFDDSFRPSGIASDVHAVQYLTDGFLFGGSYSEIENVPSMGLAYFENPIILPVELTSFTAFGRFDGVLLKWSTAVELNNDLFEIERSADGIHFKTIGFVKGHGTTSESKDYSFPDRNPNQINYYRLKQKDFNGRFEYSLTLRFIKEPVLNGFELFPNPVKDKFQLNTSMPIKLLKIVDAAGQVVHTTEKSQDKKIDLHFLSPGIYFIEFETDFGKVMKRVIKE